MNATEKEIIGLCKKDWLPSTYFMKNIDRMDTVAKNLKNLCEQKILERKTGQNKQGIPVWVYYYRLIDSKEHLDY